MSSIDQNKQLVAELFDAFRAGDTSRFDDLIAVCILTEVEAPKHIGQMPFVRN